MALKGGANRYGSLKIALHWISAAAILALLGLGLTAANTSNPGQTPALLRVHAPPSPLVLALTVLRAAWWFFDQKPDHPNGQPRWQIFTARSVHMLLHLAMIAMGGSGSGLVAPSGAGAILFFGASGPLPHFTEFRPVAAHGAGAFAMAGLLCLHTGGAFCHQVYRKACC